MKRGGCDRIVRNTRTCSSIVFASPHTNVHYIVRVSEKDFRGGLRGIDTPLYLVDRKETSAAGACIPVCFVRNLQCRFLGLTLRYTCASLLSRRHVLSCVCMNMWQTITS